MSDGKSFYSVRQELFCARDIRWAVFSLVLVSMAGLSSCGDDAESCTTGFLCTEDRNCSEGEVCNLALDPPECQELACSGPYGVCDRDDVCTPDLICSELYEPRYCAGADGDRCEMYDVNCAAGMACRIWLPQDDRTICRPVGALGSACRDAEPFCDSDLICETRGVQRSETIFSVIQRCFPPRLPPGDTCVYSWECEVVDGFGLCSEDTCQ